MSTLRQKIESLGGSSHVIRREEVLRIVDAHEEEVHRRFLAISDSYDPTAVARAALAGMELQRRKTTLMSCGICGVQLSDHEAADTHHAFQGLREDRA